MYQAATGSLPFHASCPETMFEIMTMKGDGTVRGKEDADGWFEFEKSLPPCQMQKNSISLIFVPFLAMCLKVNIKPFLQIHNCELLINCCDFFLFSAERSGYAGIQGIF